MKLNRLLLVSIILLAIISLGAVSAAEDTTANETAVDDTTAFETAVEDDGGIDLNVPVDDELSADSGDLEDVAISQDKLGVAENDEVLSEQVVPQYTYDIDLPMSGSAYVVQWGQAIVVSAKYTNATGNVTITFDDGTYTVPLVDGAFKYEITKYAKIANNRPLKVVYNGDESYSSVSFQNNIHVQMNDVVGHDANYGLNPYVEVNLYNATGNVTFTLNGVTYRKELVNGTTIQEFTNYTLGKNTVSFAYEGDDNYNQISKSVTFNVNANIDAPNIYNFQPAIINVYLGEATGNVTFKLGDETHTSEIVSGIATCEFKNYTIGSNTLSVSYSGDDTFNPFSTTKKFEVLNKENATILSSVYRTADKNLIVICIPFGTGSVNATINGKKEVLELVDGMVLYEIAPSDVITEINVTYEGSNRLNPGNSSVFKELNNVVTNDNYMYYFNQVDGGKVFDFIEDGSTLDFQGSIINPDQLLNVYFDVNKPLNIISSTNDAYIDLNTTAGSLLGENPGNRFTISYGGSWTNMTGIAFHNTQLWLFDTHHVVLDRVSNVIEDQRVGSGVGATSIRANSTWVTVKNGYFYTRNNGGSSSLVIAWADYCTFDNNTIVVEGEVGNMIYLTTYNVEIPSGVLPNVYNNITNNRILAHDKTPAAICWGLVISGANNYVADNYIDYGGVGINQQWGQGNFINNTYTGNVLVGGASANFLPTSIVYNNTIEGTASTGADSVFFNNTVGKALTVGARAEAFNNTAGGLTLSGANAIVRENVVNGASTISQANIIVENNTFLGDNTIKISNANAKNVTFANNNVVGNIEFGNKNAIGNIISGNNITTSKNYAIDLKTYTGTNTVITDNILNSNKGFGDAAINHKEDASLVIDNYQDAAADISVVVDDIKVGQNAVFNVETNETSLSTAVILVNNKEYTVNLIGGKGSVEVSDLLAGTYGVKVFSKDKNFGAQNTSTITVTKNDCPEIVVNAPEKTQWIASDITVTINDATGSVTLSINGTDIVAELVDGVATFAVPDLAPGEYKFNVTYAGDFKYNGNQTNGSMTVVKNKNVIIIASDVVCDKLATSFTAIFTNYIGEAIANANVTITIGDAIYEKVTDNNGTVVIDLALTRGIYPVNIEFKAIEDEYDANTANANILVIDASVMDIISISGNCVITGSLKDVFGTPISNANISYLINGGAGKTTTDASGIFKVQGKNNCNVYILFEGDSISAPVNKTIAIENIAPIVKNAVFKVKNANYVAADTAAGEKGKMFYFTLKSTDGNVLAKKVVKVVFNGVMYTVKTDAKGKAGINIGGAAAKTYVLTVFFMGDNNYKGAFASAKVKISKKNTSIKPKKTKYKFKVKAKSKTIKATLKTSNKFLKAGKKVTITVKGKTYSAKTGKNGSIKLKLKSLKKKGKYKAKIKFAGDAIYKACSSKTIKIIVK